MDIKSQFKGIGDAKVTERGNPLTAVSDTQPAEYELEITKVQVIHTRENYDAFIASFKVLASTNPDVKVGDTSRTWFQKMSDRDVGLGAIKAFCLATLGISLNDKDGVEETSKQLPDLIEKVCGTDQAFRGARVCVRVDLIETVKKKTPFNRHTFSPVS